MVIEIRRHWISLTDVRQDYEATVWQQEGPPFAPPASLRTNAPEGFTYGLLHGYIDGKPVGQAALWAALDTEAS